MKTTPNPEIIRMAQEAGFELPWSLKDQEKLERFAVLLETHIMKTLTREKIADLIEIMLDDERKAIIELADAHLGGDHQGLLNDIRARGKKDDVL